MTLSTFLFLLDIMMPIKNGIEALKEIRARGDRTYIMMLTAMAEEDDRVNGLDSGADDYLTKPFSLKELLARLRSLERRAKDYGDGDLEFADLHLDSDEQVLESSNSISLSREETQMLGYFILNAGKKLTADDLLNHVWSADDEADAEDVWINICYLMLFKHGRTAQEAPATLNTTRLRRLRGMGMKTMKAAATMRRQRKRAVFFNRFIKH